MTRDEFLQRLEVERRRQRGRLLGVIATMVLFVVGGAALVFFGGVSEGLGVILLFGLGGGLILLPSLLTPPAAYAGGRLEARVKPWARTSLLAAMTSIATGAVVLWPVSPLKVRVGLAICGVAAVIGAALIVWTTRRGGVVIVIDQQGYWDQRNMAAPIPWSRIEALSRWETRGPIVYRMRIDGNGPLPSKVASRGGPFGGVVVGGAGLTCSVADMLLAIQAYRPDLVDALDLPGAAA